MIDRKPLAVVVMGVSGCGKSSVGRELARQLGAEFIEGDALHPVANIDKMTRGEPLSDADRWPWLDEIRSTIAGRCGSGRAVVVSCSALRRAYRDHLRGAADPAPLFVFLSGSKELLAKRMGARSAHFMPLALLESQLATLEDPTGEEGVITVHIDHPVEEIGALAAQAIRTLG